MSKKAILIGATGLTGSLVLRKILADSAYSKVIVFTRSPTGCRHPKLEEHRVDLFDLELYKDIYKADVVFCCIGTTKSKTPDPTLYKKIDYGIPLAAARLAKENKISKFIVISALKANVNSLFFYNRVKGEMQQQVLQQTIEYTHILQPSLIIGKRKDRRIGEGMAIAFFQIFGFLIPKKYKAIPADTIANAMLYLANSNFKKTIITSDEILVIGNKV